MATTRRQRPFNALQVGRAALARLRQIQHLQRKGAAVRQHLRQETDRERILVDEKAACTWLMQLRWPNGPRCACGSAAFARLDRRPRVLRCVACHAHLSVTAGTPLHGVRTPIHRVLFMMTEVIRARRSARKVAASLAMRYQSVWALMHRVRATFSTIDVRLEEEIVCMRNVIFRRGTRIDPSAMQPGGYSAFMAIPMLVGRHGTFVARFGTHGEQCLTSLATEYARRPIASIRKVSRLEDYEPWHWVQRVLLRVHRSVSRRWANRYLTALSALRFVGQAVPALAQKLVRRGRLPWAAVVEAPLAERCTPGCDTYPRALLLPW